MLLERATKIAAASDIKLTGLSRYDVNITSGIVHTIKEQNISEVILGLHHKSNIVDSFFGSKIENLLKSTHKMVAITKCIIPVNMTTRIVVAVPEKAEYESGFTKWIDRIANIGKQIGCRVIFHAHHDTIIALRNVLHQKRYNLNCEFEVLDDWEDILTLTGVVLQDDLLVIVCARHTSLSYNNAFDKLPLQLSRYFAGNNFYRTLPRTVRRRERATHLHLRPALHRRAAQLLLLYDAARLLRQILPASETLESPPTENQTEPQGEISGKKRGKNGAAVRPQVFPRSYFFQKNIILL